MIEVRSPAELTAQLQAIDPELLGARLEVARLRRFPNASGRAVGRELQKRSPVGWQSWYAHENGVRLPTIPVLYVYSEFFAVPLDYLLFGIGGREIETKARAIARKKKRILKIDVLKASSGPLSKPVNQPYKNGKFKLSPAGDLRFIVKLMAGDLKNIAEGRAALADIAGEMLPVPPHLTLSDEIGWWQIPDHDHSMTGPGEAAFPPGTLCLIDFAAPIEPNDFVVALLANQAEPLVRRYVSDRRWAPGVKFTLEALNPHSEIIKVSKPDGCLLMTRVMFSGSRR